MVSASSALSSVFCYMGLEGDDPVEVDLDVLRELQA